MARSRVLAQLKSASFFSALVTFAALVIVNAILQPRFFSLPILRSNAATFVPLVLVAMAQGVIVLVGGVDLSIGSAITLMNVVIASLMKESVGSVCIALIAGLFIGAAIGLFNGLLVGYVRLPSIVATFASGVIWSGLAIIIMPKPGGYVPRFFYQLYQRDLLGIIPVPIMLALGGATLWLVLRQRPFHRRLYATGGNAKAAFASGVNTRIVTVLAFVVSGLINALAAFLVTAQSASGDPNIGQAFTLPSVAAVVIGGISLSGGKGGLFGAALGACIFGLLTNVIYFANVSSFYQDLIRGVIIIVALVFSLMPGREKSHA